MSDGKHEHPNPYPTHPPDEGPPWIKWIWQAVSRVALFGIGTVLVFLPNGSDTQVTAGAGMMLASAGLAIAKGLRT